MLTALLMISRMRAWERRLFILEYRRHAKSQWSPSSRLISSLLKHNPGISPRFLSQKMAQKEPEKKMPSIAAKAIMRSAKVALVGSHHWRAHYIRYYMPWLPYKFEYGWYSQSYNIEYCWQLKNFGYIYSIFDDIPYHRKSNITIENRISGYSILAATDPSLT